MSETQSEYKTQDALKADLLALCEKHGIRSASFCGNTEGKYLGIPIKTDDLTLSEAFEAVINVGRLWQHMRSVVRQMLDDFERGE